MVGEESWLHQTVVQCLGISPTEAKRAARSLGSHLVRFPCERCVAAVLPCQAVAGRYGKNGIVDLAEVEFGWFKDV